MRSVVVVLPASICAMIPMLRVFWSVYLRGMDRVGVGRGVRIWAKKMDPSGPRALLVVVDRSASLSGRGLHFDLRLRQRCAHPVMHTREATSTIAERFGVPAR